MLFIQVIFLTIKHRKIIITIIIKYNKYIIKILLFFLHLQNCFKILSGRKNSFEL